MQAGTQEEEAAHGQIFLGKQKKKGTIFMAIKENVEAFAVKQALSYLDKDPEKNRWCGKRISSVCARIIRTVYFLLLPTGR